MVIKYLDREIEACGRETGASPDAYWFEPDGEHILLETAILGICGMKFANLKVCAECLRKLGVLW